MRNVIARGERQSGPCRLGLGGAAKKSRHSRHWRFTMPGGLPALLARERPAGSTRHAITSPPQAEARRSLGDDDHEVVARDIGVLPRTIRLGGASQPEQLGDSLGVLGAEHC